MVGLTSSRYYDGKFLGLRDMFGCGVHLVHLNEPDLDERLSSAVHAAWDEAAEVRGPLRERALAQIDSSKQSFQRVFDIVEAVHRSSPEPAGASPAGDADRLAETNDDLTTTRAVT